MNKDYSYCLVKGRCSHRRGCKRWIGNYTGEEVRKLYTDSRFIDEIDFKECIPYFSDMNCENNFIFLDRFRLSTGEDFER